MRRLNRNGDGLGRRSRRRMLYYLPVTPTSNDRHDRVRLTAKGICSWMSFWSITVLNHKGYLQKNKYNAYSLNNLTATKGGDGSVRAAVWRL